MDQFGARKRGGESGRDSALRLGTNQSGMRDHNERLVLSLLRRHGSLAKSDIARMTGLSAQTISVIMRALEADDLLVREKPVRGKVGQPLVPMSLNPEGGFFLGLKIGRRSADLVLIDFLGNIRAMLSRSYGYPDPRWTVDFAIEGIDAIRAGLTPGQKDRIAGIGIAMPFELWNWADMAGAPPDAVEAWRHADIRSEIAALVPFPVYLQNDASAACGAELVFGQTGNLQDFVYFYVGAFVGGGIVLDGGLYPGRTGNAGALGSMLVPDRRGRSRQLIDIASVAALEHALAGNGRETATLWTSPDDWGVPGTELDMWIGEAGAALAHAIVTAASVIDFEAAIVDGWLPRPVLARLCEAIAAETARLDVAGIAVPAVRPGTVGHHARALGAAALPLSERFLVGTRSVVQGD